VISNFHRVLNVVFFPLGDYPAPELYVPNFRNTVCSIFIDGVSRKKFYSSLHRLFLLTLPIKMEQSVPKHRYVKFRRRGITQKKAYNNQNHFYLHIPSAEETEISKVPHQDHADNSFQLSRRSAQRIRTRGKNSKCRIL
jgi:hypothetical protein